jgi:hypothetical protein
VSQNGVLFLTYLILGVWCLSCRVFPCQIIPNIMGMSCYIIWDFVGMLEVLYGF